MVHDVRDRDDVYAFHSAFLLEVIRGKLGIAGHGVRKADVPQIVREYHARLAVALESGLKTSPRRARLTSPIIFMRPVRGTQPRVSSIASRPPGPRPPLMIFAVPTITWRWLGSARRFGRGRTLGGDGEAGHPLPAGPGDRSGRRAGEGGSRRLDYLTKHPHAPARVVLAVARLCYDHGHRSHKPRWNEEAARLCRQIVAHPASPQEEAEARHIMAVSQPAERRAERISRTSQSLRTSGTCSGGRSSGRRGGWRKL